MANVAQWRDWFLGNNPQFRRFILLIGVVTAIPMFGVPITRAVHPEATVMLTLAALMAFFGGPAHVASTSWFYADPVAREYFYQHPLRYGVIPVLLVVGTTLAYVVWGEQEPTRWINFGFTIWLLWHYQRQNWGIHSFVARVNSGESASKLEEWILKVAVVGGIIGGIHSAGFGTGTIVSQHSQTAFRIGGAVTLVLPLMIAAAIATVPGLRRSPLRIATLVGTACFFLPVFVFGDAGSAVLSYGLAHGLQYLVFMGYMATSTSTSTAAQPVSSGWRPGVFTLLIGLFGIGYFLSVGGDVGLLKKWNMLPIFGLVLGVTMAHFVVDAGVWRLRDEFPRRYVGPAFPFLPSRSR